MTFRDLIKSANDILQLPIDWDNTSLDDNYQQLCACAKLVLNATMGLWAVSDTTTLNTEDYNLDSSTLVYGVLSEYAFVAGMFNEWKVWQEKYQTGLFKAKNGQTRIIPVYE